MSDPCRIAFEKWSKENLDHNAKIAEDVKEFILDGFWNAFQAGYNAPRWISVSQLPEVGQVCIVAGKDGQMMISQGGSKDLPFTQGWVFIYASMYSQGIGFDATHWQPLPEAPND